MCIDGNYSNNVNNSVPANNSPAPQSSEQNTNTGCIWSKYDDDHSGTINLEDSSVKTIYDNLMKQIEGLSDNLKTGVMKMIDNWLGKGIQYDNSSENSIKEAEKSFDEMHKKISDDINLKMKLNDVNAELILSHPKDSSIKQIHKNGESVIIFPKSDGSYVMYRQNSEPLPQNKKDRKNYSEIETLTFNSLEELANAMSSDDFGWGRTTLEQNNPSKTSRPRNLSLQDIRLSGSVIELRGYNNFDK